jgi:hypothetical protein
MKWRSLVRILSLSLVWKYQKKKKKIEQLNMLLNLKILKEANAYYDQVSIKLFLYSMIGQYLIRSGEKDLSFNF